MENKPKVKIIGKINSSQDGKITTEDSVVPCLTSGHNNCPKIILTNTTTDGCAFTIRARYDGACCDTLTGGGGSFPCTGVLEAHGVSRTRDSKGKIIRRQLKNYVNCIHTQVAAARDNMEVLVSHNYRIRKLTPTECFRLFGVREEEIKVLKNSGISDSQLYKMAGNSIVVDVLMGIFSQMFKPDYQDKELTLF